MDVENLGGERLLTEPLRFTVTAKVRSHRPLQLTHHAGEGSCAAT